MHAETHLLCIEEGTTAGNKYLNTKKLCSRQLFRMCGQVFCNQCSSHFIDGVTINMSSPVRTCRLCFDQLEDNIEKDTMGPSRRKRSLHSDTLTKEIEKSFLPVGKSQSVLATIDDRNIRNDDVIDELKSTSTIIDSSHEKPKLSIVQCEECGLPFAPLSMGIIESYEHKSSHVNHLQSR